jgi:hypothetical protein
LTPGDIKIVQPQEVHVGKSKELSIQVLLAEYSKLDHEMSDRAQHQHTLLNITIVASGAVASFALASKSHRALAVVIPYLCFMLGALWLNHGRTIASIGKYVREDLWPQLREMSGDKNITTREGWVRQQASDPLSRTTWIFPLIVIFVLPAVAGLAYSYGRLGGGGLWTVWGIGVVLTVLSLTDWIRFLFYP